jgi:predicted amidohydrolase YtcJ
MTVYRELARRGEVLVPTVMMPVAGTSYLDEPWDALEGPPTGSDGSPDLAPLVTGPLKLIYDGAPTCAMCMTAWQSLAAFFGALALSIRRGSWDPVRTSMSVRPRLSRDGKLRSGLTLYKPEEAKKIVAAAVERGFAIGTHAEGNLAMAETLEAYEAAGPALGRHGAPRIEHALFLERELVPRLAALGCMVVAQPSFLGLPAFGDAPSVPRLPGLPIRWLLDGGVKVAGSSDFPVIGFDPLDGIRRAVTRVTGRGTAYEPGQAVTLDEALAMYTRAAAEAAGSLERCGTLEAGKRADVVVLNRALATADDLEGARVKATVIGGKVVAGAP